MLLYHELKRRNVFRVAIAYLALAWFVTEVASTLFPAFGIPDWGVRFIVIVFALGFVPSLIISWVYEFTPEGIKREKDVVRDASITHLTAKRLDVFTVGLIVVAIAFILADRFWFSPRIKLQSPTSAEVVSDTAQSSKSESLYPPNSIAVLPFVNMSDDPANEYFSDGISEELLNLLVKIPELWVISRSSSFSFKGRDLDIPTISAQLNVAHILEGSVRKAGNQVRITAQLIDARSDTHLWSETYDRTLDNIFVIQDEIAAAVVKQLKLKILGATSKTQEVNPQAYTLYLYAKEKMHQHTIEGLEKAIVLYKQALEIEPEYVAAWVGLAQSYYRQTANGMLPFDEGRRLGREAAKQALAIDPVDAPAYAWLAANQNLDGLANAAQYCKRAIELDPSHPDVLDQVGTTLRELGHLDEAIAVAEFQLTRDPVNSAVHSDLGYYYRWAGRLEEAIAAFRTALSLVPERMVTHYRIGEALLLKGDSASALVEMQQEPEEAWRLIGLSLAFYALGQKAEANEALEKLIGLYGNTAAYNIAYIYAFRGEADKTFEWLDKAEGHQDSGLSQITAETLFENIHEDPRWLLFLERIGRSPEQLAAIEFEVELPQ